MEQMKKEQLIAELKQYEKQGISLWMDGNESDPADVIERICVNEECAYMRDYVYDKGVLKELRFDKIRNL